MDVFILFIINTHVKFHTNIHKYLFDYFTLLWGFLFYPTYSECINYFIIYGVIQAYMCF